MAKADRVKLIREIEQQRSSSVITYITSTRPNLETQMAMDSIRKVYEHLRTINKKKEETKIDLFLHSNGGDGTVPWKLVTLIREYAEKFCVLVPYKAFSAATLTALGADEIVMHPMGMLGPTDPTINNPLNPADPNQPGRQIGVSVEDVTAYIALVKEDAGINHEEELVQAFKVLAERVHPLVLGSVKRFLSQSRMMAEKLLALHMKNPEDGHKMKEIVDSLTSKLYYHGHPINRIEARQQVGLPNVVDAGAIESSMWNLYLQYEEELRMEEPFQAAQEFLTHLATLPTPTAGANPPATVITPPATLKVVYVESAARTDVSSFDYQLIGQPQPATQVQMIQTRIGWQTE